MTVIIIVTLLALALALYEHFDSREWNHVTSPIRNNVVFEQRNKKYGAYPIRRDYNDMVLILLLCLLGLVGIFKVINASFIDKTEISLVPKYDTLEITIEAPPMEEIKTVETPYKVVGGGGGSGTPDDAPVDMNPKSMVDAGMIPTPSKNPPAKGNKTTGNNRDNEATSKVNDPFKKNGNGGSGGGDKGGRGTGVGDRDGSGTGPGNGPGSNGGNGGAAERKWVNKPNVAGIGDENCKVILRLIVNADGKIISASNTSQTTTTNQSIIYQVISAVKSQGRFNPVPGAKNVTIVNTFIVKPN